MFKNVIVGVDGRSGGRDAAALARRLLDPQGRLTLVHVHLETTAVVVHEFDSSARKEARSWCPLLVLPSAPAEAASTEDPGLDRSGTAAATRF